MTPQQIAHLYSRRSELAAIKTAAMERLDYVNKQSLENNRSCDHKYEDGRWAESDQSGICQICGCGMSYEHYLETKC